MSVQIASEDRLGKKVALGANVLRRGLPWERAPRGEDRPGEGGLSFGHFGSRALSCAPVPPSVLECVSTSWHCACELLYFSSHPLGLWLRARSHAP